MQSADPQLLCMHATQQVQSGVARTGKWWGHQQVAQEEVQPDIMIFAKGIASGFPFAGLATRDHIFDVRAPPKPLWGQCALSAVSKRLGHELQQTAVLCVR